MPITRFLPPAFSKRRYRIFVAGQAVSVLGNWMQQVALAWLIYRLTGSVFFLGLAGFLQQIPHLVIAPVAGYFIDRVPRVRALIAINTWLGLMASALAFLTLSGVARVEAFLAMGVLIGIGNACEATTRQSLIGAIVEERALLPSAIGFSSAIQNAGRLIGPAIAGMLLQVFSEAVCFSINAVSFIAIIGALLAMRLEDTPPAQKKTDSAQIRETLAKLTALPVARYLLPSASMVALCALPMTQLMPSVAVDFFGGNAATVGTLLSSLGAGALCGALFLAMQKGHRMQFRLVQVAPVIAGIAMISFSFSRTLWLSMPLLAIQGMFVLLTSVSTNTLLQQSVDDSWRGRVIGLYFMCYIGLAPIGNLLAGTIAAHVGLGRTLALNGLVIIMAAIIAQVRLRGRQGAMERLRESVRV